MAGWPLDPTTPLLLTAGEPAGIGGELSLRASLAALALTLGLAGLKTHFGDKLFSASMVARGKPEPDLFFYAAEQMGQSPENCVVVEDSLLGVTAAVAAGMRVLAYAAETDADALRAAGGRPFDDMAELPGLLGIGAAVTA